MGGDIVLVMHVSRSAGRQKANSTAVYIKS